jgi:hypothetical protein
MTERAKIQAVPIAAEAVRAPEKRLDAGKRKPASLPLPERLCSFRKCRQRFAPRRKNQLFCSASCRKADWFLDHYGEKAFSVGDQVIDLNGRARTIVDVVHSVAYELDAQPGLLYQADEIHRPARKEKP